MRPRDSKPAHPDGVQAAWQTAAAEAVEMRHDLLEPLHLFMGICSIETRLPAEAQEEHPVARGARATLQSEWEALAPIFGRLGLSPATLREDARSALGRGHCASDAGRQVNRSDASRTAFWRAAELAKQRGASAITLSHLFAALLDDEWGAVATFLVQHGVNVCALAAAARATSGELVRRHAI
jgi:ATP-dependent Clp protease ATP-binding subunit ClpA